MSACAFAVAFVPKVLNLAHGFWFFAIHLGNQNLIHLFAISHSLWVNFKCLVEKVVFACYDVDEVSD